MSRIGKKIINIPNGVVLDYNSSTNMVSVNGGLGKLETRITDYISIKHENSVVEVLVNNPDDKFQRAVWGTTRSILQNMVEGVSKGFTKEIELNGVGFRMELGTELVLFIGFSHPVKVKIPSDIQLTLNKNMLSGTSKDKQLLGDFFSKIFHLKPCDVYKHKGFKFPGSFYRKKVGKKSK